MITQAYFTNISQQIEAELENAKESIIVAVAWLTNRRLFDKLCEKSSRGFSVELMIFNDDINNNCSNDFERLTNAGGKVYKVGSNNSPTLMHNKFCVIDFNKVINGSFNWSYKAENNHENITISSDAEELALQFIKEFRNLKKLYFDGENNCQQLDISKVMKRLTVIKSLIELEETEEIPLHLSRLQQFETNEILNPIITSLGKKQYGIAISAIENFIHQYRQITTYIDPEINGLRLEARSLEIQIKSLSDEKVDAEKLIQNFNTRHAQELGPIIIAILLLLKKQAKTEQEQKDAEADFKNYNENYTKEKDIVVKKISYEDAIELKKLYRKASKLCHPDAVEEANKETSEKWFISLQDAYEHNDVEKVNQILSQLESGIAFESKLESISEKEKLKSLISDLHNKIEQLMKELIAIKNSEQYIEIYNIEDWDAYFSTLKNQLLEQLKNMQNGE